MDETVSIYTFLQERNPDGRCSDIRLPDHATLGLRDGQTWVPGAYESLVMRSMYSIRRPAFLNYRLARKVRRQILHPSAENRARMERALSAAGALAVVDPLGSFLTAFRLDREAVAREARRLARESDRRELVKIGIALLGLFGTEQDFHETVRLLGFHEEFTFFAAPAATALLGARRNGYLLEVAGAVDGWGKINALYELDFDDPAARDFLLRRGCANRLGLAVTANLCATKGNLAYALERMVQDAGRDAASDAGPEPDAALYRGLCDILTGLLAFDGEHDSLMDYKDQIRARRAFAALCETQRSALTAIDPRTPEILDKMR